MNLDLHKSLDLLQSLLPMVWRASWQAAVLSALVLLVSLALRQQLPARWRYRLWMLVLVRLALPVLPSSPVSIFNYATLPSPARNIPAAISRSIAEIPRLVDDVDASDVETVVFVGSAKPRAAEAHDVALDVAPVAIQRAMNWMHVLGAVWGAGVIVLLLRIMGGTIRVQRLVRRLAPVTSPETLAILNDAAATLAVRRVPTVLAGDSLASPALFGWMRPRLLMPTNVLAEFSADELRLVFLHELAHLKRRDVFVNWLTALIATMHWFNPIVWLTLWQLRVERELACDELVLTATTQLAASNRAYGQTLLRLLESFTGKPPAPLRGGVGLLEGKRDLKGRIAMIAKFDAMKRKRWTVAVAVAAMGVLSAVTLTDRAKAEEKDIPSPASTLPATQATPSHFELRAEHIEVKIPAPATTAPNSQKAEISGWTELRLLTSTAPATLVRSGPGALTPEEIAESDATMREMLAARVNKSRLLDKLRQNNGENSPDLKNAADDLKLQDQYIAKFAEVFNKTFTTGKLKPNDLVMVSIMDMVAPGVESVKTTRISAHGKIAMPYIGEIEAVGKTKVELEKAIVAEYRKQKVVQNAVVVVSLPERGESHQLAHQVTQAKDPAMMGMEGMSPEEMMGMGTAMSPQDMAVMGMAMTPEDAAMMGMPRTALDKTIPDLNFDAIPLIETVEFFRGVSGANLTVDWRALEAEGLDRQMPITMKLKAVPLSEALDVLLRDLHVPMAYEVKGHSIHITTAEAAGRKTNTQTYDVRDLLAQAVSTSSTTRPTDQPSAMKELIGVITTTVAPDTWRDAGGEIGTITSFGPKLIVTTNDAVHAELKQLLTLLREQADGGAATKPAAGTQPYIYSH